MSAEPMMDIDFASIQKMFKARDEKYAREAAQRRPESRAAEREGYRPAQRGASQRSTSKGTSRSSVGGSSYTRSQGGKRQEPPVRRTYLEDMPERDEFRPRRRNVEDERAQRTTQGTRASHQRSKGGAHLETSKNRATQNPYSRGKQKSGANPGGIAAGVAGVSGALIVLLNSFLPSAPADTVNDKAQGADNDVKPIHYYAGIEEGDTIKIDGTEYYVNYGGSVEYADTTEDGTVETLAPEETAPPYVPIERVSDNLIDAMKTFEGCHLEAYVCPGGALTIGFGHTAGVYEGQTITLDEAKEFLREDLASCEKKVSEYAASKNVQLTQGQFDALVDFAYNLGRGCFEESGLVEMIGEGDLDGAAAHMNKYVWAKDKDTGEMVKLGGLVTRRAMEADWLYS